MFQKKVVDFYLSQLDNSILLEKYNLYSKIFLDKSKQDNIRKSKEEQYQEGFLRDLFVSVLGYTIKPENNFNLFTEAKNEVKNKSNSKKADGAICEENNENNIKAVIELKGTSTKDLDLVAFQAFSYKNFHNDCKYIIVSNFENLRFYVEIQSDFEEFNLFNLSFDRFCLLYLILEVNQLKNDIPLKLKNESLSEEKQITDEFYSVYSSFKRMLFEDIKENNADIDKLLLFKKTQKLLDRILFIRFCSDRGLLPTNSILNIIKRWQSSKENFLDVPLYSLFKQFFNWIDKGFENPKDINNSIFAYNGGLFKPDDILDNIKIGDDVLYIHCNKLAQYNFNSQISVDILGRIFENSLTEIEEVEKEIEAEKQGVKVSNDNKGKRKKDGVFYTPEYITNYIVENTIGVLCSNKRKELDINETVYSEEKKYTNKTINELEERLTNYRNWLFSLKVLDCACGSGAFLNSALKQLRKEHRLIDSYFNAIQKTMSLNFESIENDNSILENNLYGVDINEDSIEITKLSLWLNTAKKNRKLTTLNNKIKCGNSLIDNTEFEKSFNWKNEFPEVFENGGFDVIISNPPYVRAELLPQKDISFYKENYSVFNADGDLFSYFYEKGLSLLKENGLFGFISNTFDKTKAGKTLREFIATKTKIEKYIDFTEVQIFTGATTYPIILILKKNFEENNSFIYKKIPNSMNGNVIINSCKDINVSQNNLNAESWSFESNELKSIMNKITSFPTVSKKYGKCFYGVKTALNEAFFIDEATKNRLIEEDSKSKDLIKKVFEGKDLKKWFNAPIEKYILSIHNGYDDIEAINIDDYTAIKNYLNNFYDKLEKRYDKGKTPYNLRNCAYQSSFEKNKIIWGNLQNSNKFSFDTDKTIVSAPCCMLPTDKKSLVSILNSKLVWKFLTSICVVRNGGYIEVKPQYFERIPIPDFENNKELDDLTEKMLSLNEDLQKKVNRFINRIKETYSLEKITQNIENFYNFSFADFVKELSKQKIKLTMLQKDELEEYFNEYVKDISALNETINKTDKEINNLVYSLYNLSKEEIETIEAN